MRFGDKSVCSRLPGGRPNRTSKLLKTYPKPSSSSVLGIVWVRVSCVPKQTWYEVSFGQAPRDGDFLQRLPFPQRTIVLYIIWATYDAVLRSILAYDTPLWCIKDIACDCENTGGASETRAFFSRKSPSSGTFDALWTHSPWTARS